MALPKIVEEGEGERAHELFFFVLLAGLPGRPGRFCSRHAGAWKLEVDADPFRSRVGAVRQKAGSSDLFGPGRLDVDDSRGQYRIIESEPGRLREELAILRDVAAPVVNHPAGLVAEQVRVQVSHRHRA